VEESISLSFLKPFLDYLSMAKGWDPEALKAASVKFFVIFEPVHVSKFFFFSLTHVFANFSN
jgi:hypothetical protein